MISSIEIGIVPGTLTKVVYNNPDMTYAELFALAGVSVDGAYSIRSIGMNKNLSDRVGVLPDGSQVVASPMIKGN